MWLGTWALVRKTRNLRRVVWPQRAGGDHLAAYPFVQVAGGELMDEVADPGRAAEVPQHRQGGVGDRVAGERGVKDGDVPGVSLPGAVAGVRSPSDPDPPGEPEFQQHRSGQADRERPFIDVKPTGVVVMGDQEQFRAQRQPAGLVILVGGEESFESGSLHCAQSFVRSRGSSLRAQMRGTNVMSSGVAPRLIQANSRTARVAR